MSVGFDGQQLRKNQMLNESREQCALVIHASVFFVLVGNQGLLQGFGCGPSGLIKGNWQGTVAKVFAKPSG